MNSAAPILVASLVMMGLTQTPAQPPAQPPAGQQQPPAKPPAKPGGQASRTPAPNARQSLTITVTNLDGRTLPGVWVKATGPVDREAPTDDSGTVVLRNMLPGTYRVRFEHDDYVTFEKEVTQAARALTVNVALNAAPPKAAPPPTPPPPQPVATTGVGTPAKPTALSIIDLFEKNFVGGQPQRLTPVACTSTSTSSLLQVNNPLAQHAHDDADEVLYVIAGEGVQQMSGRETRLEAGVYVVVPRGTSHSLTKRGSRPLVLLSTLEGKGCTP